MLFCMSFDIRFLFIPDRVAARPPRPLSGAKSQRSRLATPLCRYLFFQVRRRAAPRAQWPRDPGRPMGPEGDPRGGQGDPRGGKGTQGRLRRPWGSGPMGPFGGYSAVIPNGKPFRVEGYYERKAIPKENCSEWRKIVPLCTHLQGFWDFQASLNLPLFSPLRGFVANVAYLLYV